MAMNDFEGGTHLASQLDHCLREKDKSLRVVLVSPIVSGINSGPVKIFIPAKEMNGDAFGGFCDQNLGSHSFFSPGALVLLGARFDVGYNFSYRAPKAPCHAHIVSHPYHL